MKKEFLILILIIFFITGCKTKTYTVTIIDDDKHLSDLTIKKGDNISNITPPSKEGYIFLGWLKDNLEYDPNTPVNDDITLTIAWTEEPTLPNNHIVVFNFGDYTKKITVKDGDKVNEPKEIPKKEKYKFIGWYDNDVLYDFNKPVTKDIIIVAKFEKNRIIISYDLDGDTGSTIQVEIEKGTVPSRPKNPEKFGYTFANWLIKDKVYNFDTKLYEDTTIKANYTPNIYYKVTFDSSGGSDIAPKMLVAGEKLTALETPIKEGYTFKYWDYDGEKFNSDMTIDKDITLVAIYEKNA